MKNILDNTGNALIKNGNKAILFGVLTTGCGFFLSCFGKLIKLAYNKYKKAQKIGQPMLEEEIIKNISNIKHIKFFILFFTYLLFAAHNASAFDFTDIFTSTEQRIENCKQYYEQKNYKTAFINCFKAVEKNNSESQYYLALMYYYGYGIPEDKNIAVELLKKASENGNADAQGALGLAYSNGNGVAQDRAQAVHWWQKAAEQGNAPAQNNLGLAYSNGNGVAQDRAQAVYWWQKAAKQGNADAKISLKKLK